MLTKTAALATKELSKKTWPDFVKLFSQRDGWDHCWCMHFHRPRGLPKFQHLHSRREGGARNRRQKKALVDSGRSQASSSTTNGQSVGWCQYGRAEELPRIDSSRQYRRLAPKAETKLWRITCFVVLKRHRRRGVATAALKAAWKQSKRMAAALSRPTRSLAANPTPSETNQHMAPRRCLRNGGSRSWCPLVARVSAPTCSWVGRFDAGTPRLPVPLGSLPRIPL
jgi:GNAT superfamily N-acetyltransferase